MLIPNYKSGILSLICVLSLILLLFSEIFYINTGFGAVSIFLLAVIPLTFGLVIGLRRFSASRLVVVAYLFNAILVFYTAFAILLYSRINIGIQFASIFFASFLFLNIGFFCNPRLIGRVVVVIVGLSLLFAISQYAFYSFGYNGPFSIFEKLSDVSRISQSDFNIEVIYGRSTGIFNSPNVLGLFSGLAFWLIYYCRNQISKSYFYFGLLAAIFCLILSSSRGSLTAFLFSGFIFILLNFKKSKQLIGAMALTSILGLVLLGVQYSGLVDFTDVQMQRFSELSTVYKGEFSGSENLIGRFDAWGNIYNKIVDMPMGTIAPPQLIINESPDNQFVYFFAQGGFLLLSVSVFLFLVLLVVAKNYKFKDYSVFLTVVVFVVINSLSIVAMNIFVFMLFWMYLGLYSRSDSCN